MKGINVGLELIAVTNIINRKVEYSLKKNNPTENMLHLSGQNGLIINFLYNNREKDICQRDIEDFFSLARSTISTNLRLMEKKGLIRREKMLKDTRQKKVTLTERSMEFERNNEAVTDTIDECFDKALSSEEKEQFVAMIKKIRKELES
ncbi:MarR family transcriptional regulator [Vallitalea longa]|uniref:MarR family transcriptional regulator n=1 Tax=Vallitalea longa TaxID=2936439 RepID=A0A9W6DEL3_9FIRM|nr:MarR family transcriptional regulator [Vallitalea longa]GKX29640.1 MarR family transcriptional regulator [Vallitalea longa]